MQAYEALAECGVWMLTISRQQLKVCRVLLLHRPHTICRVGGGFSQGVGDDRGRGCGARPTIATAATGTGAAVGSAAATIKASVAAAVAAAKPQRFLAPPGTGAAVGSPLRP